MRNRLLRALDPILSTIVIPELKDSAIGDLWESHYRMKREGLNSFKSGIITLWRSCLLVKASVQIYYDNLRANNSESSFLKICPTHLSTFPCKRRKTRNSFIEPSKLMLVLPIALTSFLVNLIVASLWPNTLEDHHTKDSIVNIFPASIK